MKLPYSILVHWLFWLGYLFSEILIQQDMAYSQWLRWHLSDVFAGPSFGGMAFASVLYIFKKHLMAFGPLASLLTCFAVELFLQKTDPIDIWCYVLGTIGFYLTCFLIQSCQKKTVTQT